MKGLPSALARSNLEAAGISLGFEVNQKRDSSHDQDFPEKQNVEMVQLAVPYIGGGSWTDWCAETGHDVIAPSRNDDDAVPREPRGQNEHPEKDAELLGEASRNDTVERTGLRD